MTGPHPGPGDRQQDGDAASGSTKSSGRTWTGTGILIGDAPNPVMPKAR
jgi:hypothetical protein